MKIRLRNRTKLFSFVMLASLLALFVIFRGTRQEVFRPTIIDFDKIKDDMTESEVEAILGPPHKVLTWKSRNREVPYELQIYGLNRADEKVYVYYGATNEERQFERFDVTFDVSGRVNGSGWGRKTEQSVLQRLMEWLKKVF